MAQIRLFVVHCRLGLHIAPLFDSRNVKKLKSNSILDTWKYSQTTSFTVFLFAQC